MSTDFESIVIEEMTKEKRRAAAMKTAYPYVKNICEYVVSSIGDALREAPDREDGTTPRHVEKILTVLRAVQSEPTNILMQVSELDGFARGSERAINVLKETQKRKEEHEAAVQAKAEELSREGAKESTRRKIGDRPESLKTLRLAQEKLEEMSQSETDT